MINLRLDGNNGTKFTDLEQLFDLDQAGQIYSISNADLIKSIEQQNILILLHGFYPSTVDVLSFYLTLEEHYQESLSEHYDAIIGLIWPCGESKNDYYHSKQNAEKTGTHFRDLIYRLNNAQCTIDILSHGMGSLVVYHSIPIQEKFSIRNIFSVGPGIPQEVITNNSQMDRVRNQVKNIYVFYVENNYSSKDRLTDKEVQQLMAHSERVNWEEQLTRMDNISLANITELMSHYPGYQSLTLVTEFIGTLLSSSQNLKHTTLNEAKERILKSTLQNEH